MPTPAYPWSTPDLGPLSEEEIRRRFNYLKARLVYLYREELALWHAPRTVVVVPSLTLDQEVLSKVTGVHYYEERLLYYLILLQLPRTQVIFVTSQAVDPVIIDYFINLLPGVPVSHARSRLTLLDAHDASPRALTEKILERPWLIRRIREAIRHPQAAYLECFNSTPLERELAVRLGIPLYAVDPDLIYLGSKTGNRRVFAEAGITFPRGYEDLHDEDELVEAMAALKMQIPLLRRAVVKLNEGFSGEGNALFSYEGAPRGEKALQAWLRRELPKRLRFEAEGMTYEAYMKKFRQMGGIVEEFIEGQGKRSPSVQGLINPLREGTIVSTHDQILGGPTGQVYLGARFPARPEYRLDLQEIGRRIGEVLSAKGAVGRFAVDFVSVPQPDGSWEHYALEINLRKGGTTHPFMTLKFLTDGHFDLKTGLYYAATGIPLYYYASDNLKKDLYRGLTPEDLMDIVVCEGLHYNAAAHEGVVFHIVGALSEYGKLGVVAIGPSYERSEALYHETVAALDRHAGQPLDCRPQPGEAPRPAPTHFPPWWRG
ncbi:MAG: carboxylate-amine ligase [Chloroflexi bacterium]|nr:carboxylate-amine ligase [Chloroflexota bacterium]